MNSLRFKTQRGLPVSRIAYYVKTFLIKNIGIGRSRRLGSGATLDVFPVAPWCETTRQPNRRMALGRSLRSLPAICAAHSSFLNFLLGEERLPLNSPFLRGET